MKILIAGANGYIGTRLFLKLLEAGHEIYPLIRSEKRIEVPEKFRSQVHVLVADLLKKESLEKIPQEIEAAYYLVHSMSTSSEKFDELEAESARNFIDKLGRTKAKQILYLSGLANEENLSKHLASRKNVEEILRSGKVPVTTLMAGIIVGSGSASFEIMRDLVEKLPIMVAPKWTVNLVQPIAIRDVLDYLVLILGHEKCIGERFEIGGPNVLSYKELLLELARVRGLKRYIFTVPVLTPKLSSYWLYFVTAASFSLAQALVQSLKNNAICKEKHIQEIFPKELLTFEESIRRAFQRLEEDAVPSSWKDAFGESQLSPDLSKYITVPEHGVLKNIQHVHFDGPPDEVQDVVWGIGGDNGWLYMNWSWHVRGFIDKLFGGVGLRRGRRSPHHLKQGDALDFWRVLIADSESRRLLLYAEMKLPGEAWLEFKIEGQTISQTATFRPLGLFGRLYWYVLYPFHFFIFRGMVRAVVKEAKMRR